MFQISDYILALFMIIAVIWEFRFRNIPKIYFGLGGVVGLFCHVFLNGVDGFLYSFAGIVAALLISLFLYFYKALSLEDVVLFMAIGSFVGFVNILYTSIYAIFFALVIGAFILSVKRVTFVNKLCNKCIELLNSITSKHYNLLSLEKEKTIIRFPFIYAMLSALILHYYSIA